jgi:hypothetical protein
MGMDELFKRIREFSKKATLKEKEIKKENTKREKENIKQKIYLLKQYNVRVENVVRKFAYSVGGRIYKGSRRDFEAFQDFIFKYFITSGKWYGFPNYSRDKVCPSVEIFFPFGIGIDLPDSLYPKLKEIKFKGKIYVDHDSLGNAPLEEGYFLINLIRTQKLYVKGIPIDDSKDCTDVSDKELPYYFIPFKDFTEEKLAAKILELYKEAMGYYLQSLKR